MSLSDFIKSIKEKVNKREEENRKFNKVESDESVKEFIENADFSPKKFQRIDYGAEIKKLGTKDFNENIEFEKVSGIGVIRNNTDNICFIFRSVDVYNLLIRYYKYLNEGKHANRFLQQDWDDKSKNFTFKLLEKVEKDDLNKRLDDYLSNLINVYYNNVAEENINPKLKDDNFKITYLTLGGNLNKKATKIINSSPLLTKDKNELRKFISLRSNYEHNRFIESFNRVLRRKLINAGFVVSNDGSTSLAGIKVLDEKHLENNYNFIKVSGIGVIRNNTEDIGFIFKSKDVYGLLIKYYKDLKKGKHFNRFLQYDWNTHSKNFTFELLEGVNENNLYGRLDVYISNPNKDWYNDKEFEYAYFDFLDTKNSLGLEKKARRVINTSNLSKKNKNDLRKFIVSNKDCIKNKPLSFVKFFKKEILIKLKNNNLKIPKNTTLLKEFKDFEKKELNERIDYDVEIRKLGTKDFNEDIDFEKVSGIGVIRNNSDNISFVFKSLDVYKLLIKYFNDLNKGKHRNKFLQKDWNSESKNFSFEVLEKVERDKLYQRLNYYLLDSNTEWYNNKEDKSDVKVNKLKKDENINRYHEIKRVKTIKINTECDYVEFLDVTNINNVKKRANDIIFNSSLTAHKTRLKNILKSEEHLIEKNPVKFMISFNKKIHDDLSSHGIIHKNKIDINPKRNKQFNLWAEIFESYKSENYQDTIKYCEEMSNINNVDKKFRDIALLYKGHAYYKLNNIVEANISYKKYLKLHDDDKISRFVEKNNHYLKVHKIREYLNYPNNASVEKDITNDILNNIKLKPADKNDFKFVEKIYCEYKLNTNNSNIKPYIADQMNYSLLNYSRLDVVSVFVSNDGKNTIKRIANALHRFILSPVILIFVFKDKILISLAHFRCYKHVKSKIRLNETKMTKWIDMNDLKGLNNIFLESLNFNNLDKRNFYRFYTHVMDNCVRYNLKMRKHYALSTIEFLEKGDKLYKSGEFKRALKCYDNVLKIREDINAIIGHIKASYQTNSFRQFYSPKNPIECYKIAFAFYELNDFDKALNYINVCLKLDSNYTNAIKLKKEIENIQNLENIDDLINNAKTSFNAGDYNEAIEYCDKILKIDQREEILNIKVESLYALNRPEDAMEVYKKFKK